MYAIENFVLALSLLFYSWWNKVKQTQGLCFNFARNSTFYIWINMIF